MSKKGYGNLSPRFQKYFARHRNSSGAHDPKNAKQEALDETAEHEAVQPCHIRDVYVVGIKTVGGDTYIGSLYFDREDAESEVAKLEENSQYNAVWFDIRQIEEKV